MVCIVETERPIPRTLLIADIAIKLALLVPLLSALARPGPSGHQGEATLPLAVVVSLAAFLVPAIWWLRFRDRPFPVTLDVLWTLPFLIGTMAYAVGSYVTVDRGDDLVGFVDWFLITSAASLVIRQLDLATWNRIALATGFAVTTAVLWELAEYVTLRPGAAELTTAYADTLADLLVASLGGALAAALVAGRRPRAALRAAGSSVPPAAVT